MAHTKLRSALGALALLASVGLSFKPTRIPIRLKRKEGVGLTRRHGVAEWREAGSDVLALIPFSLDEILLPGQSRYLHFYEERLIRMGTHPTRVLASKAQRKLYQLSLTVTRLNLYSF